MIRHIDIGCIQNRILPNYMVDKNKTTTKEVQYVTKKYVRIHSTHERVGKKYLDD